MITEERVFDRLARLNEIFEVVQSINPNYSNKEHVYECAERLFIMKYGGRAFKSYDSFRVQINKKIRAK